MDGLFYIEYKKSVANPCIIQTNNTVLLEEDHPLYEEARGILIRFAELVKSPEQIHTYRITPLSVWNACSSGIAIEEIIKTLKDYAKYPVPPKVERRIREYGSRFGKIRISGGGQDLVLSVDNSFIAEKLENESAIAPLLGTKITCTDFSIQSRYRGKIKQLLIKEGYPVHDCAGYSAGEKLHFSLRIRCKKAGLSGNTFIVRDYQHRAALAFHAGGTVHGGSGVIVLPCGAGKTIVGIMCMHKVQEYTLILTSSITAIRQWKEELLHKTTLKEDEIGEYSGLVKEIRPVTISSYQILSYRGSRDDDFIHFELFKKRNWGLIIYDEVHLLPAPVFQVTADLQAKRRLGLTATLVREDGKEDEVFALIGPKKFDLPWKELEKQGWIARARCTEVRLPLEDTLRYARAPVREKFRIASENPHKIPVVLKLLEYHETEQVLIIGMYLAQLKTLGDPLGIPVLTGSTPHHRREELYAGFRNGTLRVLAVSKVANFAVDLPDASVAIQISGTYGSRQEEAQRLGRILRPKEGDNQAYFYTLVSENTTEQQFALKRQLFLCEQGYEYKIVNYQEFVAQRATVS
jgi:DNA excision repair protein ERCC-3